MRFFFRMIGMSAIQSALQRMTRAVTKSGGLGRAVEYATLEARDYAAKITHVQTGWLKASHRTAMSWVFTRGTVYIEPASVNPFGERPYQYGPVEEARSGPHAFYYRTVSEAGPRIANRAMSLITREF